MFCFFNKTFLVIILYFTTLILNRSFRKVPNKQEIGGIDLSDYMIASTLRHISLTPSHYLLSRSGSIKKHFQSFKLQKRYVLRGALRYILQAIYYGLIRTEYCRREQKQYVVHSLTVIKSSPCGSQRLHCYMARLFWAPQDLKPVQSIEYVL